MKKYKYQILFFLCLLAGLVTYASIHTFGGNSPVKKNNLAFTNLAQVKTYWSAEINRIGPEGAYSEFVQAYPATSTIGHAAAHVLGNLLFSNLGVKGLSVCDEAYGYGCYHGFISEALTQKGFPVLSNLESICNSVIDGSEFCFHGVGHGLLEYLGAPHFIDALLQCKSMATSTAAKPVVSCSKGVFMDYSAPFMANDVSPHFEPKALNSINTYAPCTDSNLPKIFTGACYFSLPHWWLLQSGIGVPEVGALCAAVPQQYQENCYSGLSVDLPRKLNFDQQKIINECNLLPNKQASNWCLKDSVRILISQFHLPACKIEAYLGELQNSNCGKT